ncbi:hypothetical protein BJF78_24775 [Pseudonocardia sp. CNS-139]|nr:hypothetical protein BJF78_24775 [Pseudonocardia sp. CNS-139]
MIATGPPWFTDQVVDAADDATLAALTPPAAPSFDLAAVEVVIRRVLAGQGVDSLVGLACCLAMGRAEAIESFCRLQGAGPFELDEAVREWVRETR